MSTAQSRTTTIAELKRAGYAFDPSRAANWYAGILQSLLSKGHQSDRIDLLAERTLKQMDILTRGNRRAVILEQVEKSIKRLCSLNVLNQYRPDRVRLQPGLPKAKLERYLAERPVPWESETSTNPVGPRSRQKQDEDSDDNHHLSRDDPQIPLFPLPGQRWGYAKHAHVLATRQAIDEIADGLDAKTAAAVRPFRQFLDDYPAWTDQAKQQGRPAPDLVVTWMP